MWKLANIMPIPILTKTYHIAQNSSTPVGKPTGALELNKVYSYTPTYLTPSLGSLQATSKDTKLTQLSEKQLPHNANSKLSFYNPHLYGHLLMVH